MSQAHHARADAEADASSVRRAFALPNTKPKYAPDRQARIDHIALELRFDFARKILYGRCTTTVTANGGPLHSVELQASHMVVKSVRAGGKALHFELEGDQLRIDVPKLAAGKSTRIAIEYEVHQPGQGIYFIAPDKGYPRLPHQVWTQGQDADAHYWFPCVDHPNAKATSEVIATVPADFFVLSNGALVSNELDKGKKTRTYHWKMDIPHVTYLVSVVAGKFVGRTSTADGIPVSWYVEPGREAEGQRSFGKTPKMLRFFNERIGVAYPYAKYAQIAVREFIFGGMENTTCTTQTDATLHDARAELDFSSDALVAHELAHQWFGDLLTCKDWPHAWLNEGFATYFDLLFKEHDRGQDEFAYQRILNQDIYLKEDRERYRRPIVTRIFREPVDLFDRHLYEKGGAVLHMLRVQLGDELWWRAINRYVRDNAQGSVETVDLGRAIEAVSGRDFSQFFDQWIFRGGHPEFSVAYRWEADTKTAVVDVKQTQSEGDALFVVPVALEFGLTRGKRERFSIRADQSEQSFRFTLPARPETFVFDPNADVLATVKLEVPSAMLVRQLLGTGPVGSRVAAARALALDPSPGVVEALARTLASVAFWGVRAEAAKALGRMRTAAALDALVRGTRVAHPKVRRAVAEALGEFRGDAPCAALGPLLNDKSYFVEAAAATSIGKTKSARAFELLRKAMAKESFNDVVRCGALAGLGELGDERGLAIALEWTAYGRSTFARRSAIAAVGQLGERRKDAIDALIALLDDKRVRARTAAAEALGKMNATAALSELDRIAGLDVDGRLKSTAIEAAQKIRAGSAQSEEVKRLRHDVDEVRAENAKLLARLAHVESERPTSPRRRRKS